MRFFVDGTEWKFPHMDSLPRTELLDALREQVASEGRVIVDMLSDGESIDDKAFMSVPDAIDVEVYTATPWGLGLEILNEAENSLQKVFRVIQEAFDSAEIFDPLHFREAYEQLEWICDVFDGFRDAYAEYDGEWPNAVPLFDELKTCEALLTDGRYADANEWHECVWKVETLPYFVDKMKALREWFESRECEEDDVVQETAGDKTSEEDDE